MRTFDDIIPPSRRREADPSVQNPTVPSGRTPSRRPSRFPYLTIIVVVLIVAVSVGALLYFTTAKVTITPNTLSVTINSSFTADMSSGTLPFEVISSQKVALQSVPSDGQKMVTTFASGMVTIYNKQARAQRLVTDTRFAAPNGLIYRIHAPVVIPAGNATHPGSVTALLTADAAGGTYNIGPASFTVPGLAGTALASQVYARSDTAMTGGASGAQPSINATTAAQTKSALILALGPSLTASLQGQVPAGYVLLPGAATTTYQELVPTTGSSTGMVNVREQGTITAVVFPNAALAHSIAASVQGLGYQGEPLTLSTSTGLSLSSLDGLPGPGAQTFTFTLSGTASLIYTVNPTQIAAAVAGKTRSAAEVALTNYTEVKQAVLILRPFWRQSFPQDPSMISVHIVGP